MLSNTDILLGALHLGICIPSLLLSAVVVVAIHCLSDIYKTPSYRILQQLNVCYIIHITVHIGIGITIFLGISHEHYSSKVLGAFAHVSWLGLIFLNFLLALERVNVTVFNGYIRFGRFSFFVISCLAWLPGTALLCLDLTPYLTFYFNPTQAQWNFFGPTMGQVVCYAKIATFILLPATFVLYLVIYLFLAKQKRRLSPSTTERPKYDLNVLYASTLTFLYLFTEEAIYFGVRTSGENRFCWRFATHIMWISVPLFCHLVQLIFNRSIRWQLVKFVKNLTKHRITVINVQKRTHATGRNAL